MVGSYKGYVGQSLFSPNNLNKFKKDFLKENNIL